MIEYLYQLLNTYLSRFIQVDSSCVTISIWYSKKRLILITTMGCLFFINVTQKCTKNIKTETVFLINS